MRQIQNKEEIKKKQKRNQVIIGIALVVLMVSSTIGFAVVFNNSPGTNTSEDEKISYNGIEFTKGQQGLWEFNVQGSTFTTYYSPKDTESIEINLSANINDFAQKPLYFSSTNKEAISEIATNIGRISSRAQEACLNEETCENKELPIKTCSDNIIIILESNETKTYKQDKCIFIESPKEDHLMLSDKLVFRILGIQ